VQNAVVGLEQARARLEAATKSRVLAEQSLQGDQTRFSLGATTPYQVILDQRDLANANNSETQAMANYAHTRISLDQARGETLSVNHIALDEALKGRLSRVSVIPGTLPAGTERGR